MKLKQLVVVSLCSLVLGSCSLNQKQSGISPAPSATPALSERSIPAEVKTNGPTVTPEEMIITDLSKEFAAKYNKSKLNVSVKVDQVETNTATGSVSFKDEQGGAKWYAALEKGGWMLVHDGQDTIKCADADEFAFSKTMVSECLSATGKLLKR